MFRNNEIHCQICKNEGHEALLCPCTARIYCKSGNHISYYCESDKNKMECNLCNQEGHTINTCKFNTTNLTHCQYCQILGDTVIQCSIRNKFEHGCYQRLLIELLQSYRKNNLVCNLLRKRSRRIEL